LPTFIMIFGCAAAERARSRALDSKGSSALVDEAGVALGARDGDLLPVGSVSVPCSVPTMAGTPSSRLTIAAWQVRPPRLVTMAAAFFMIGSQSGSVLSVTSTSPGWNSISSAALLITRTGPVAIFSPTLRPVASTRPRALQPVGSSTSGLAARLHRLGPRLHDEQLAGAAVLGPLDVHRRRSARASAAVVVLDHAGPAGQRQDLVVVSAKRARSSGGTGTFLTARPPPTS
jgi:hypothetical protein